MFSKCKVQLRSECQYNLLPLILVHLIILGACYLVFGVKNLDPMTRAIILERFLPIMGVFSLGTLFYAEHKSPIKDILIMKNTSIEFIYFTRLFLRLFLYSLVSLAYGWILSEGPLSREVLSVSLHSISIGTFIGGIGLVVYSLTNNISLVFFSSIGLILMQWFASKEVPSLLLLFTLPRLSMVRVAIMLMISFVLVLLSIKLWRKKQIS